MINCNPTIVVGKGGGPIVMGVVGNFNARQQSFDLSFWLNKLGPGQLVVALLRPGDSIPYAVSNVTISGSIATWTFSETDTAKSGYGKVFLTYSGADFKDATTDYSCFVAKNSAPTGEVPSDLESWYQNMLDAAATAKESAIAAAGSASAASDSAAAAEAAQQHGPKIGENGNWWVWDAQTRAYVDSGVPARGDNVLVEQDTDGFYINRIVDGGGSGGSGGGSVTVDTELSATSENPVQNKVIKSALDGKGTYSKPSGGIPKTDLDTAVQTSLGKADTALQEHQSLNGYATQQWVDQQGYLTAHQDISDKAAVTSVPASGRVSAAGVLSFANSAGAQLFTVQLPLYAGGVD